METNSKQDPTDFLKQQLLECIAQGDKDSAMNIIHSWAASHNYEQAVSQIMEPALADFGKEWGHSDNISLGQGYVLSKVAEETFQKMAAERSKGRTPIQTKGPIVIGNILDDSHSLGRKLVITFLELDGWKIVDLGNDVDPEDFVDRAMKVKAPIIAVSAMMLRTAMNIQLLREEIDKRGLRHTIKLAAGGAVFCQRPSLVKEVGADGTADNAIKTPALMEKLLNELKAEKDA